MADDILSQFLVRIAYQQDEKSRQKFDDGLKQVQTRAAEFGAKIGELPTIVGDATKRISSSLTELYYAGQRNGATARELDALRKAAEQSGEGAANAEASFNAFSQRPNVGIAELGEDNLFHLGDNDRIASSDHGSARGLLLQSHRLHQNGDPQPHADAVKAIDDEANSGDGTRLPG